MPKRRGSAQIQLLRGALFTLRRKCGKPTCRCATGEPHETPALAYPAGGRTKTITLAHADVAAVRAALTRYAAARAEPAGEPGRVDLEDAASPGGWRVHLPLVHPVLRADVGVGVRHGPAHDLRDGRRHGSRHTRRA